MCGIAQSLVVLRIIVLPVLLIIGPLVLQSRLEERAVMQGSFNDCTVGHIGKRRTGEEYAECGSTRTN